MITWRGTDEDRTETAKVDLREDGLHATGVQETPAYRLEYELDVGPGWVTRCLRVRCGDRALDLDPADHGALDCDLGLSPLTNTMPICRHRLLTPAARPVEIVAAWVSVPDLTVHRSPQRYEPVDAGHVRYVALDGDFTALLAVDPDGLVRTYEHLAERTA